MLEDHLKYLSVTLKEFQRRGNVYLYVIHLDHIDGDWESFKESILYIGKSNIKSWSRTGLQWHPHRVSALRNYASSSHSPPSLGKMIRRAWRSGEVVQAGILEMPGRSRKFGQVLEATAILYMGEDNLHNSDTGNFHRFHPAGEQKVAMGRTILRSIWKDRVQVEWMLTILLLFPIRGTLPLLGPLRTPFLPFSLSQ